MNRQVIRRACGSRAARAPGALLLLASVLSGTAALAATQQLAAEVKLAAESAGTVQGGTLYCEVGDRIVLAVEVTGEAASDASPPEAPDVPGLKIEVARGASSQLTIINGARSERYVFAVYCYPEHEGEVEFPPLTVKARGERISATTNTFAIKVKKGMDLGNVVQLVVKPSLPRVYMHQPFTIRAELRLAKYYYNSNRVLDNSDVIELPWIASDDHFVAIGAQPELTRRTEYRAVTTPQGGAKLMFIRRADDGDFAVLAWEQSYLAKAPGTFRFDPPWYRCELATKVARQNNPFNFFGNGSLVPTEVKVARAESPAFTVEVLPIPAANRPPTYVDAVGQFDFNVDLSSSEVTVGDSLSVALKLRGTGNLEYLTMPAYGDWNAAGFREFKKQPLQKNDERQLIFDIAPIDPSVKQVPAIAFSYFDPLAEKFVTVERGPFPITVRPHPTGKVLTTTSPDAAEPDVIDIHTIKRGDGGSAPALAAWVLRLGWVPVAALSLLFLVCALLGKRWRRLARDRAWARARAALASFKERLREVEKLHRSGRSAAAYAALSKALAHYVGDKLDRPGAGLLGDEAAALLRERAVNLELVARVQALFQQCETAHYAPAHALDGLDTARREALAAVQALEESVR